MSLPKIEQGSFTQTDLLCGKKIGIRKWKVREEKELLFQTESVNDKEEKKREINQLMRNCVDDKQKYDSLSESDILLLGIELRKKSKGERIEYSYTCPHCKTGGNAGEVDLLKDVIVRKFNPGPHTVGEFVFTFKEVPLTEKTKLVEKYAQESTAKFNFFFLISSIHSVKHKGELYTSFIEAEAIEFFDDLDTDTFRELYVKLFTSISSVAIQGESACAVCKKTTKIYIEDIYDFFVF